MLFEDLKISNLVVGQQDSIKEVLEAITYNCQGTAIVVDDSFSVVGVVSDGDIRRFLLRGNRLTSPVSEAVNLNPVFLQAGEQAEAEIKQLFENHPGVTIMPVVDKDNRLVDVVVRNRILT